MANPARLEMYFPGLRPGEYEISSEESKKYNCCAWAASEQHRHWSPVAGYYWPIDNREDSIGGWIEAFGTLRFTPCENGGLEAGVEKLALYADEFKMPTHISRQLHDGRWTSKIGVEWEDIIHLLAALTGKPNPDLPYGNVVAFLRRPLV